MKVAEMIFIDNLKCGGCANTIRTALMKIKGIEKVRIFTNTNCIEVEGEEESIDRDKVIETLGKLGYPERGTTNNLQKAKSYFSCMIGRFRTIDKNQ